MLQARWPVFAGSFLSAPGELVSLDNELSRPLRADLRRLTCLARDPKVSMAYATLDELRIAAGALEDASDLTYGRQAMAVVNASVAAAKEEASLPRTRSMSSHWTRASGRRAGGSDR